MTEPAADCPISNELRDEAREHIRDHARKEAARIQRLSRVREFVLGAQARDAPVAGGVARCRSVRLASVEFS
jgi:hypothetical protein